MKVKSEVLELLKKDLKFHKIEEIEGVDMTYDEFKDLYNSSDLKIGYKLSESVVDVFGNSTQKFLDKILLSSPIILGAISIFLSFYYSDFGYLIGIGTAILGLIMSTPAIMKGGKGFGGLILIIAFGISIYYYNDNFKLFFLIASYWIVNFLLTVNRELNRQIMEEAIFSSELVFIYYYLRGEFFIKRLSNQKFYFAK